MSNYWRERRERELSSIAYFAVVLMTLAILGVTLWSIGS